MREQQIAGDASLAEDHELGRDGRWRCSPEAKTAVRPGFESLKLVNANILPAARRVTGNNALNLGSQMGSILGERYGGAERH